MTGRGRGRDETWEVGVGDGLQLGIYQAAPVASEILHAIKSICKASSLLVRCLLINGLETHSLCCPGAAPFPSALPVCVAKKAMALSAARVDERIAVKVAKMRLKLQQCDFRVRMIDDITS